MPVPTIDRPVSALRQRMIEDMTAAGEIGWFMVGSS